MLSNVAIFCPVLGWWSVQKAAGDGFKGTLLIETTDSKRLFRVTLQALKPQTDVFSVGLSFITF